MVLFSLSLVVGLSCASASAISQSTLLEFSGQTTENRHVAIVGAGIGGAAAAFDLYENTQHLPPLQITIFEREPNAGGRIQSSYLAPSEGSFEIVENGAAHFFTDDWCLTSAMQDVGLKSVEPSPQRASRPFGRQSPKEARTGIKCNAESGSWQDFLSRRWKYGSSWPSFHTAVRSVLKKWDEFGDPRNRPIDTVTEAFQTVWIPAAVYGPAEAYFKNLSIGSVLHDEFIQPCTRARFSQNLINVSGLSALLAAGRATRTSVKGGNVRLVERLIRLTEADLQLNSVVTTITPGSSKRYRLSVSHSLANTSSMSENMEFDMVIIATPLESSGIDLSRFSIHSTNTPNPRIDTHVTHFSSSMAVSSNLSILPLDVDIVDEMTITTSTTIDDPNILSVQRSKVCFRRGCLPGDDCDQCGDDTILYRVLSRRDLQDYEIIRMIGQDPEERRELEDYGIGIVTRHAWPASHPVASEGQLQYVDDIEVAPSLYYLNGAESIINSMEMSCRMGRIVAKKARVKFSLVRL